MSVQELRKFAQECVEWAHVAVTEEQRDLFLKMARASADAASKSSEA
jgi:hypothetical protein